jgi:hypothetical protein
MNIQRNEPHGISIRDSPFYENTCSLDELDEKSNHNFFSKS